MAPVFTTLAALRLETLLLLAEKANSTAQDIPSGAGGTVTQTTAQSLTLHINRALFNLARYVVPRRVSITLTFAAGQDIAPYTQASTADGSQVFFVRELLISGQRLLWADAGRAHLQGTAQAAGAPEVAYRDGQNAVGLAPYPATVLTCTGTGYAVPPPLVLDTDTAGWLDADLAEAVVAYAAARVGMARQDDAKLAPYAGWLSTYERTQQAAQQRLILTDPTLARLAFGLVAGVKAGK